MEAQKGVAISLCICMTKIRRNIDCIVLYISLSIEQKLLNKILKQFGHTPSENVSRLFASDCA